MNPTSDEAPVRTTVSIPKPDYAEIEKIAREMRVSVAWVVREAVTDYIAAGSGVRQPVGNRGALK